MGEDFNFKAWMNMWLNSSGVNIIEPSPEGDFNIVQSCDLRGKNKLRQQKLDIGLYNEDGEVHIIEGIVIKDEHTPVDVTGVPEAFGPVKAIFVNQGEHAYAKVRFDHDSIQWFIKNLNKVQDSTTRGAIWRYFWMSVMEKSMKSSDFINFIVNQLPHEPEERILMTGLMQLRALINNYLPVELVAEKKAALFDAIYGVILKGTATLEPMADQLFGFIST